MTSEDIPQWAQGLYYSSGMFLFFTSWACSLIRLLLASLVFLYPKEAPYIPQRGGWRLLAMLSRRGPRSVRGTGAAAEPGLIVPLEAVLQAWLRTLEESY